MCNTVLQFWTELSFDGEFENKAITFIDIRNMIQDKKKPPDRNQAHCYTHASPNARCAKRTST